MLQTKWKQALILKHYIAVTKASLPNEMNCTLSLHFHYKGFKVFCECKPKSW